MTKPVKIAIAGLGTVGGGVMKALGARQDELSLRAGRPLIVTQVSARDAKKARGFDLPGFTADPLALARSRATPSQGAMPSAKARRRNVQRAFTVPDPERVAGRRILLVDDVVTTGATAQACARALKRAGAQAVHVLALARVVKASDMLI